MCIRDRSRLGAFDARQELDCFAAFLLGLDIHLQCGHLGGDELFQGSYPGTRLDLAIAHTMALDQQGLRSGANLRAGTTVDAELLMENQLAVFHHQGVGRADVGASLTPGRAEAAL